MLNKHNDVVLALSMERCKRRYLEYRERRSLELEHRERRSLVLHGSPRRKTISTYISKERARQDLHLERVRPMANSRIRSYRIMNINEVNDALCGVTC